MTQFLRTVHKSSAVKPIRNHSPWNPHGPHSSPVLPIVLIESPHFPGLEIRIIPSGGEVQVPSEDHLPRGKPSKLYENTHFLGEKIIGGGINSNLRDIDLTNQDGNLTCFMVR